MPIKRELKGGKSDKFTAPSNLGKNLIKIVHDEQNQKNEKDKDRSAHWEGTEDNTVPNQMPQG
jgi:hypothetical protein